MTSIPHTNPDPTIQTAREAVHFAQINLDEARREVERFTELKRCPPNAAEHTRACIMVDIWTDRERERAAYKRECLNRLGKLLLSQEGI